MDEAETEARTLAQTDALTGVINRRYLSEISHKILTHPQSYPITGILLDMNDFKQVNDEYGHLIGDQMLISFCECVRAEITETDIFGRFGGDEFALLLPQTDQKGAIGLLDRISSRLEMLEIKDEVGRDVYISLSAGVISMNVTNPIDFEYLVRHADQGLYKAKKKSRNSTGLLSFEIIQKHN